MDLAIDLVIIFTLRLLDVGMATVRIVLLGRGRRGPAAALGFVEALIWVLAITRVLGGLNDPARMVAFALGFAAGTYLGSVVEEWLALGQALVRIVAPVRTEPLAPLLRSKGYGATVVNGDGLAGDVRVTFCVVPRKEVYTVTRLIHEANPAAYVTVDQTSTVDLARHGGNVNK
ncbi:MAG TPA: DUF5698 domain-containing protein [Acidimicrobiia bacterium]|jgi:uncharacterized protein YebE (UPF0316 family)